MIVVPLAVMSKTSWDESVEDVREGPPAVVAVESDSGRRERKSRSAGVVRRNALGLNHFLAHQREETNTAMVGGHPSDTPDILQWLEGPFQSEFTKGTVFPCHIAKVHAK